METIELEGTKSYGQVTFVDPSAMFSAAGYLMSEWGEHGYSLGFVGLWVDSVNKQWHVWQCHHSDGSRWLIRSDAYSNAGTFEPSLEAEVSRALNVESHNDTFGSR